MSALNVQNIEINTDTLKLNTSSDIVDSIVRVNNPEIVQNDKRTSSEIRIRKCDTTTNHEIFLHNTLDIIYSPYSEAEITASDEKIHLKGNSIIMIAPGVPYSVETKNGTELPVILSERSLYISNFHLISKFEGKLCGFIADAVWGEYVPSYILYSRGIDNAVFSLFAMLTAEERSSSTESNELKKLLLMTLYGYLTSVTPSSVKLSSKRSVRSAQIAKILSYIQENYRTITLEKLADNFHYTVPYVSKLIRSVTGMTFTDILREIRFEVCRSLLINSDLKINKIAEISGFQNTDHFNRIFKKHMGVTPTDYKKSLSRRVLTTNLG